MLLQIQQSDVLERLLHVRHETLEQYGAVSTQTAEEMAEGAAKAAEADAALSVTGIAGPSLFGNQCDCGA